MDKLFLSAMLLLTSACRISSEKKRQTGKEIRDLTSIDKHRLEIEKNWNLFRPASDTTDSITLGVGELIDSSGAYTCHYKFDEIIYDVSWLNSIEKYSYYRKLNVFAWGEDNEDEQYCRDSARKISFTANSFFQAQSTQYLYFEKLANSDIKIIPIKLERTTFAEYNLYHITYSFQGILPFTSHRVEVPLEGIITFSFATNLVAPARVWQYRYEGIDVNGDKHWGHRKLLLKINSVAIPTFNK